MTHPFHPLSGREFDLVVRKKNWGENRVFFFAENGQLTSLPAGWTDVDPPDPFVAIADGRSMFRVEDLSTRPGLAPRWVPTRQAGHSCQANYAEGVKVTMPKMPIDPLALVGGSWPIGPTYGGL